jgi:hypothetical protein
MQVRGIKGVLGIQDERTLQHIVQFADVARPLILLQRPYGTVTQGAGAMNPHSNRALEKMLGEGRDIVHPFTQGRERHGDHREPAVEFLT